MQQRVVCAANRDPDGTIHLGLRHFDQFMRSNRFAEQGFVDNKGNFLTREEAWEVATATNQILRRVGGDEGKLFSENLY